MTSGKKDVFTLILCTQCQNIYMVTSSRGSCRCEGSHALMKKGVAVYSGEGVPICLEKSSLIQAICDSNDKSLPIDAFIPAVDHPKFHKVSTE